MELDAIPPPEQVAADKYEYSPCPLRIGPFPLHPRLFMHSFLHPKDHLGSLGLPRLPKKLHSPLGFHGDELAAGQQPEGWGIYIVEGLSMVVVQVAWTLRHRDIHGLVCFVVRAHGRRTRRDRGGEPLHGFTRGGVLRCASWN